MLKTEKKHVKNLVQWNIRIGDNISKTGYALTLPLIN